MIYSQAQKETASNSFAKKKGYSFDYYSKQGEIRMRTNKKIKHDFTNYEKAIQMLLVDSQIKSTNIADYLKNGVWGVNSKDFNYIYSPVFDKIDDALTHYSEQNYEKRVESDSILKLLNNKEYIKAKSSLDSKLTNFLDAYAVRNANMTTDLFDEKSGINDEDQGDLHSLTTEMDKKYQAYNLNMTRTIYDNNVKPAILSNMRDELSKYFNATITGYPELMNLRESPLKKSVKTGDLPKLDSKIYTTLPEIFDEVDAAIKKNKKSDPFRVIKSAIGKVSDKAFEPKRDSIVDINTLIHDFMDEIQKILKEHNKNVDFNECRLNIEYDEPTETCLNKLMKDILK